MNPDTVTFLVGLAMLAIGIIGTDALTRRARRAKDEAYDSRIADLILDHDAAETERDAMSNSAERAHRRAVRAEADHEWATLELAVTEAERDTFRTAFTAEMLRQARAELLRPDEASGLATVHEIKAGRA